MPFFFRDSPMPQNQEFKGEQAYSSKLVFQVLVDLHCRSEVKIKPIQK